MAVADKATIRLKFPSQKQVSTLLEVLTPEANAPVTSRANVKLKEDGLFLELTVEADDTVALRATLNAYLRWINSTVDVMYAIEHS